MGDLDPANYADNGLELAVYLADGDYAKAKDTNQYKKLQNVQRLVDNTE